MHIYNIKLRQVFSEYKNKFTAEAKKIPLSPLKGVFFLIGYQKILLKKVENPYQI